VIAKLNLHAHQYADNSNKSEITCCPYLHANQ